MEVVVVVCGVVLVAATLCTIYRLAQGPTLLDRVVASDVLLAIVGAAVAVDMVYRRSYENMTLLLIVSLVGFLGSVTVARFANNQKPVEQTPGSQIPTTAGDPGVDR